MSRTTKDKPSKLKHAAWDKDREYFKYTCIWENYAGEIVEHEWKAYLQTKTTKPKKRKKVDHENHWMTTPSWWNNLFHTRPIRGNFRTFLSAAKKSKLEDIEGMLEPTDSKSPHKYFW